MRTGRTIRGTMKGERAGGKAPRAGDGSEGEGRRKKRWKQQLMLPEIDRDEMSGTMVFILNGRKSKICLLQKADSLLNTPL